MKDFLSILKFLFKWPLSIMALFFILKITSTNITKIQLYVSHVNYILLFYGIFCFLIYFFLRGFLWQRILKANGHHLPLKEVSYLWGISELKRYIPGNILALATRTVLFSEKQIDKKVILSSLFTESQIVLLSSLVLCMLSIDFIIGHLFTNSIHKQLIMYFTIVLLFLILFFYVFHSYIIKQNLHFPKIRSHLLWRVKDVVLPNFNAHTNFSLLLIGIVTFLFFALGTYFSISSLLFLNPLLLFIFLGLFSFSLLVGYLSFITPMGLGVREGVITWGLSQLTSLASVGFASIYTRIVFVISELFFIILLYLWKNIHYGFLKKIEQFVQQHKHETFLLFFVTLYCMYFIPVTFLRFENFYAGRFDLGNMDQTVWNTTQGRIFQLTNPNGTKIISRLSFHADVILILLSSFYYVWSDPRMLLLLQTLILAFGSFFVFLLAKKIVHDKTIALVLAFTYLLNPYVHYVNLYDFHAVTFATTFLLGAFYFMLSKRYVWFLIFLLLSAITKEHVWLIVSMFGVFLFFNTSKKMGLAVFVCSVVLFYYLVWHAIPSAKGAGHFALEYYSDFGSSPTSIVKNMLLSPFKTIEMVLQEDRIYYLYQLSLPVGFLPIFSPTMLFFAAPDLFINLLSNNNQLRQIYYQYTATITPFLFIAAIYGVKKILTLFPKIPRQFIAYYLLFTAFYAAYLFGPLPGAKHPNLDMIIKPQVNKEFISSVLQNIPQNKKIAATNNLGAHLAHRQYLFTIPVGIKEADIIIFLLGDIHAQPSPQAQKEMVIELKSNPVYKILAERNNFIVFEKTLTH